LIKLISPVTVAKGRDNKKVPVAIIKANPPARKRAGDKLTNLKNPITATAPHRAKIRILFINKKDVDKKKDLLPRSSLPAIGYFP